MRLKTYHIVLKYYKNVDDQKDTGRSVQVGSRINNNERSLTYMK